MHNGIGKALVSLIYPIKYLNEPFLPYKSFSDKTMLLISALSILIVFFIFMKCVFINTLFIKNQSFFIHFNYVKKNWNENFMLIVFALR